MSSEKSAKRQIMIFGSAVDPGSQAKCWKLEPGKFWRLFLGLADFRCK